MSRDNTVDFYTRNIISIGEIAKKAYRLVDDQIQHHLGLAYEKYLSQLKNKYSRSKSFFTSNQAVDLYDYYVSTNLTVNTLTLYNVNIDQLFKHSLHSVISGTGGCGKTVLMKHLLLDNIKFGNHTPIYIELRDLDQNLNLEELITDSLKKLNFDLPEKFVEKLKKSGQLSLFLDGYDEVHHELRIRLIKDIKKFVTKYSACPVIISTRPDDTFKGIDEFTIFEISPLTPDLAKQLILKIPYDEEVKKKFIYDLENKLFSTHHSFVSNPLLLSIMLLTYNENANTPQKLSIFYNQAFEALFHKHDAKKGAYSRIKLSNLDIQDFSNTFSLFCLQTYDKRIFKMARTDAINYIKNSLEYLKIKTTPENYLHDLISATCLLIEDGIDIAFSHRSFQEYFVALYISKANAEMQHKLIEKYSRNIILDNVIHLLKEINQDLVEEILYIPYTKRFFDSIEVKNRLTSKNLLIFFKNDVNTIQIQKHGYGINFSKPYSEFYIMEDMIMRYREHSFNEQQDFLYELKEFIPEDEDSIEFKTSKLTTRTKVFRILAKKSSWLSIIYFQLGYDILKSLIKKHEDKKRSLEELIDI